MARFEDSLTSEEKRKMILDKLIVDGMIDKVNYIKMQIMLAEHRKLSANKVACAETEEETQRDKREFANEYNAKIDANRAKAQQALLESGNTKPLVEAEKNVVNESSFAITAKNSVLVTMAFAYKKPANEQTYVADLNCQIERLRSYLVPEESALVPTILSADYQDDHGVETLSDGTVRTHRQPTSHPLESAVEYSFAETVSARQRNFVSAVYIAASVMQDYTSRRNYGNFFQLPTPVEVFLAQNEVYLNTITKTVKPTVSDSVTMSLLTLSLLTKVDLKEFAQYSPQIQQTLRMLEDLLAPLGINSPNSQLKKV